jgi:hypothetical protein
VKDIKSRLREHFGHLCEIAGHTYAPFVAFIHDVCVYMSEDRPISIRPERVSLASSTSHSYHSGILLLESMIMSSNAQITVPQAKKARVALPQASICEPIWYELARLNQAIGEDDVLRGVFRREVYSKQNSVRSNILGQV